MRVGDKILCRKTKIVTIPNKNIDNIIWKFGKRYRVFDNYQENFFIETERSKKFYSYKYLKDYFLIDKKRIRKFKIFKLKKNLNESW